MWTEPHLVSVYVRNTNEYRLLHSTMDFDAGTEVNIHYPTKEAAIEDHYNYCINKIQLLTERLKLLGVKYVQFS
ncbi:MAG: hypothetical protein ACFFG0_08200 [Candidatus Thorarchaeota archaeon]